jgi:hypothetical protein
MSTVQGFITNVWIEPAGTELVANVLATDTVLQVDDAYPFETSGTLTVNGVSASYVGVDYELNTITLSLAFGTTASIGDEVNVSPAGQRKWAMVASDDLDEGVRALVPYAMSQQVNDGMREDWEQEQVLISDEDGRWKVTQMDEEIPVITGTQFQTASEGPRMVMRQDIAGGVVEGYAGITGESPALINPGALGGTSSMLQLSSGFNPTKQAPAQILFSSDVAGGNPQAWLVGTKVQIDKTLNVTQNLTGGAQIIAASEIHSQANGIFMDDLSGGGLTTASIGNSGRVIRTTSSKRYKKNIKRMTLKVARTVLGFESHTFKRKSAKGEPADDNTYPGFIAEQVHDAGGELWVNYDKDGQPDGVRYDEITVAHNALIKDLMDRVEALEAQLPT